jgi:hypothetical protein
VEQEEEDVTELVVDMVELVQVEVVQIHLVLEE